MELSGLLCVSVVKVIKQAVCVCWVNLIFMPEVIRGYSCDGVFESGCSGVSRKALPVVLVSS